MIAEGALDVHGSENAVGRVAHAGTTEARLFLSTRLVRELVAADALADAEGDDRPALAARLLDVIRAGLHLPMAGIVDADRLSCIASFELPEPVRAVLEGRVSGGAAGALPLVRRALEEHRVFLVGRASRDPLMVVLRDARPDIEAVAVVPLHDRDLPTGLLVLGASDDSIVNPSTLRTLTIAFRLIALLLSPARGTGAGAVAGTAGEAERYLVEIEELETRLAEASELVRRSSEQASSEVAALRAEVESGRARIAELEAAVAGERNESDVRKDFEAECARLRGEIEARCEGVRALEEECEALRARLAGLEDDCEAARVRAAELEQQLCAAPQPEPGTLELEPTSESLGAFLAAAAAEVDGDADVEAEPEVLSLEGVGAAESDADEGAEAVVLEEESAGIARSVWHVESAADVCHAVDEVAHAHGVPVWRGQGERPSAHAEVAVVNLLDPALADDLSILAPAADRALWLYGFAQESGLGFELGAVCCVTRPVEPQAILAQIQSHVGRKLTGVVLVSHQLRELAAVRAALSEIDAAGSVACDARQALDLLEIVRRPDALLIDLSLPGGQGLALAHQLRRSPETGDIPILFLLPAGLDLLPLRAAAERAGILGPYGPADVRRLATGALSARR